KLFRNLSRVGEHAEIRQYLDGVGVEDVDVARRKVLFKEAVEDFSRAPRAAKRPEQRNRPDAEPTLPCPEAQTFRMGDRFLGSLVCAHEVAGEHPTVEERVRSRELTEHVSVPAAKGNSFV